MPNQVYKDQPIDWVINIQFVHRYATSSDDDPFEELSIDGANIYFIDVLDNDEDDRLARRLSSNRLDRIQGYVSDQKPAKSSVARARFTTGDSFIRKTALHCNFVGDECWNVRTHARIDSLSMSTGYKNGGQVLTISGWGLESGVSVTVEGITCEV